MSDPDSLDLDALAARTIKYADQLRDVSRRFHGYEHPTTGQKFAGVKLQYEEALDSALDAIVTPFEAEGKRPPAEDIRAARARQRVKREHPSLYDEFHALDATIRRIQRWLRDADSAIRAKQSVLKTEREMAGRS